MNARTIVLQLSLIDGVGPATIAKISAVLGTADATWLSLSTMTVSALVDRFQIGRALAQKIEHGLQDTTLVSRELKLIRTHAINWITILEPEYPALLRHIHIPPPVLYWQGNSLSLLSASAVAMIGSRKANQYGQRVINRLVPPLVRHGYTIVSGGAIGADTMVHRAVVEHKGITIVVLGSGLLRPYPRENSRLFKEVMACGGAIMSIFPLMTEPVPGNFPVRNRVIAGLSQACVVVQAAARSGTAITATYALEQGRNVFAVPGPIDDELSVGCHALIKEGATVCTDVADIIGEYAEQTYTVTQKTEIQECTPAGSQDSLVIWCAVPRSMDELVILSGAPFSAIQDKLFELQLQGLISQDFAGMWTAR